MSIVKMSDVTTPIEIQLKEARRETWQAAREALDVFNMLLTLHAKPEVDKATVFGIVDGLRRAYSKKAAEAMR